MPTPGFSALNSFYGGNNIANMFAQYSPAPIVQAPQAPPVLPPLATPVPVPTAPINNLQASPWSKGAISNPGLGTRGAAFNPAYTVNTEQGLPGSGPLPSQNALGTPFGNWEHANPQVRGVSEGNYVNALLPGFGNPQGGWQNPSNGYMNPAYNNLATAYQTMFGLRPVPLNAGGVLPSYNPYLFAPNATGANGALALSPAQEHALRAEFQERGFGGSDLAAFMQNPVLWNSQMVNQPTGIPGDETGPPTTGIQQADMVNLLTEAVQRLGWTQQNSYGTNSSYIPQIGAILSRLGLNV